MEIVPGPDRVHVTAVFEVPVTVAVNCCVPPWVRIALEGERETETGGLTVTTPLTVVGVAPVPSLKPSETLDS